MLRIFDTFQKLNFLFVSHLNVMLNVNMLKLKLKIKIKKLNMNDKMVKLKQKLSIKLKTTKLNLLKRMYDLPNADFAADCNVSHKK